MTPVIEAAVIIRRLFSTDHTTETDTTVITIVDIEMIAVTGKIVGTGETAMMVRSVGVPQGIFPQRDEMAHIRMGRFIPER